MEWHSPRIFEGIFGNGLPWYKIEGNGVGVAVCRADKKRNKRHNNGQQNLLVRTI